MEPIPTRQLTYNYLLTVNSWLLINPSHLCCDWTMGTIPLINSIADHRNLITLLFYVILATFIVFMLRQQDSRNRAVIMVNTSSAGATCLGLTRSGLEPIIYCTRGKHADHYTTHDAVNLLFIFCIN